MLVLLLAFVAELLLYLADRAFMLTWLPDSVHEFVGVGPVLGSTAANAMAGVIVGNLFVNERITTRARLRFMSGFALAMLVAGTLLRPLHGIHKIGATESYTLVAAGLCCTTFTVFYALVDVRGLARGLGPLSELGQNALLAYIMPGLFSYLLDLFGLLSGFFRLAYPFYESAAPLACLNALCAALFFAGIVVSLGRAGLTLRF
jgi:predicted acyltransferase